MKRICKKNNGFFGTKRCPQSQKTMFSWLEDSETYHCMRICLFRSRLKLNFFNFQNIRVLSLPNHSPNFQSSKLRQFRKGGFWSYLPSKQVEQTPLSVICWENTTLHNQISLFCLYCNNVPSIGSHFLCKCLETFTFVHGLRYFTFIFWTNESSDQTSIFLYHLDCTQFLLWLLFYSWPKYH